MIYKEFAMSAGGSMDYAHLTTYLLEFNEEFAHRKRPLVLICPGGGYRFTSKREAEPIAMQLCAMGYHAAILYYSVAPAVYPTALWELADCVALLRSHADEWGIDADHIAVMGFSAGAHLAGCLGVFWNRSKVMGELPLDAKEYQPNGLILCYPVITSGEHAHQGSFEHLLGENSQDEKLRELLSLEKQVNEDVPPTFMWHTANDASVPVQNSLLMAAALAEHQVPVEYHLFREGIHGLGLAVAQTVSPSGKELSEGASRWIDLLETWLASWSLE